MNPLPQKLINHLRSITLSDAERAASRAALIAHMRESGTRRAVPSLWSGLLYTKHVQVAFLSFLIVIGYGSSMTLAAEGALPGDILYPIKTRVNEPVARLITATSPAAEATFETKLLEKRLEEVETLDTREKLDPELKRVVREVIREQSIKARTKIKDAEDALVVQTLSVATSTVEVNTSTPETPRESVSEKKNRHENVSDDKRKGEKEHALKAVLKKHERILEKLDLDAEEGDRSDKEEGD